MSIQILNSRRINPAAVTHITVMIRHNGAWLYCRNSDDGAWSFLCGERCGDEIPRSAAKRITKSYVNFRFFDLLRACPYTIDEGGTQKLGLLFFADADKRSLKQQSSVTLGHFPTFPHAFTEEESLLAQAAIKKRKQWIAAKIFAFITDPFSPFHFF
jgi:Predicted NTP pyrophosphohydrolase